eukprot:3491950-Pleurochrysis_carterae.AAC.1
MPSCSGQKRRLAALSSKGDLLVGCDNAYPPCRFLVEVSAPTWQGTQRYLPLRLDARCRCQPTTRSSFTAIQAPSPSLSAVGSPHVESVKTRITIAIAICSNTWPTLSVIYVRFCPQERVPLLIMGPFLCARLPRFGASLGESRLWLDHVYLCLWVCAREPAYHAWNIQYANPF